MEPEHTGNANRIECGVSEGPAKGSEHLKGLNYLERGSTLRGEETKSFYFGACLARAGFSAPTGDSG